jgi:uncharacterized protein YgiM (DUF1202 family)
MRYLNLRREFLRPWGRRWTLALLLVMARGAGAEQIPGIYLTTADVNVRKGPSTNYQVVATIPKGIKVNVVAREGQWLRIESKHGNQPGYISERYARPLEPQQAYQAGSARASVSGAYRTKGETDLREGPGLKYKVVARLPAGIKINVARAEGEWLRVESKRGNQPGYVEMGSVEPWTPR